MPADETARQHAVSGDADAKLAAGRKNVVLDAARDQRIFDLQVGDRMHGVGAANGVGTDFRKTDMLDIAGLHHLGDGADRVLDRHRRIEPRRAVDVDMIDAESLQRVGEEIFHRYGAAIDAGEAAGGVAERAELDADLSLVAAAAFERVADQQLIVADAVEVAGVEQRAPRIQRGVDGTDALAAVGGAVKIRHAHAAEADDGDARAGCAQFAMIHGGAPKEAAADDPAPS